METLIYDYGVSVTIDFDTYITANPEAVASSFTPASGDVKYSTNHGSTFTSTTNTASFANGVISVVLTATEMQVSEMVLKFEDQDAALVTDSMVKILTKNHASAFYSGIDVTTDSSGNVTLKSGTHTGAVVPTVSTLTGHTPQTADHAASIAAILADTNELQTDDIPATLATIAGYLDTEIAAIKAVTDLLPDAGALSSLATAAALATAQADLDTITGADGVSLASAQGAITFGAITITVTGATANITLDGSGTGDALAFTRAGSGGLFGANWQAAIQAIIDANASIVGILADTGELQSDDIPSTLSTIAGYLDTEIAAIKAVTDLLPDAGALSSLLTHLTDIKGGAFSGATDSLEAIRDRGDAAWTTGAGGTPPDLLVSTTIATLASQTVFTLTAGSADNNSYPDQIAIITDSATSTQKAVVAVSSYNGGTLEVTLAATPAFTIAIGDTVEIVAATGAAGSGATASEVWNYATRVLTAGTNLNDLDAAGVRAAVGMAAANMDTQLAAIAAYIDTEIGAIQSAISALNDLDAAGMRAALGMAAADFDTEIVAIQAAIAALNDLDEVGIRAALGMAVANLDTQIAALPTAAENRTEMDANSAQLAAAIAAVAALENISAADVKAQISAYFGSDATVELLTVPAATAPLADKINWAHGVLNNKKLQTATTKTLRNAADTADIATGSVSDDATTFTDGALS